jgi:hypothetical protein
MVNSNFVNTIEKLLDLQWCTSSGLFSHKLTLSTATNKQQRKLRSQLSLLNCLCLSVSLDPQSEVVGKIKFFSLTT